MNKNLNYYTYILRNPSISLPFKSNEDLKTVEAVKRLALENETNTIKKYLGRCTVTKARHPKNILTDYVLRSLHAIGIHLEYDCEICSIRKFTGTRNVNNKKHSQIEITRYLTHNTDLFCIEDNNYNYTLGRGFVLDMYLNNYKSHKYVLKILDEKVVLHEYVEGVSNIEELGDLIELIDLIENS